MSGDQSACPARVYPRVCGGTVGTDGEWVLAKGLSPRVRGNPVCSAPGARHAGSIPACAGEPGWPGSPQTPTMVYPRVCGGTQVTIMGDNTLGGLSPRVRGNLSAPLFPHPRRGSIPACAGEPAPSIRNTAPAAVYPRVCGGTQPQCAVVYHRQGLSPRVRGNLAAVGQQAVRDRSIPACAGEPFPAVRGKCAARVYPRVCGGTLCAARRHGGRHGLSPRVRGNRISERFLCSLSGSIPACAGEPVSRRPAVIV